MDREDPTEPGTRVARRSRIEQTTSSNAIAAAAVRLASGADVEDTLTLLYERAVDAGHLQQQSNLEDERLKAAQAREQATRYSAQLVAIRETARRLSEAGVVIHPELAAVIRPKEVG